MGRRDILKRLGFSILSFGLIGSLVGCGENVLTWVNIIISSLKEIIPIFQIYAPGVVADLNKALKVAEDLETALKNKSINAIDLLNQFVAPDGLFDKILNDVFIIKDENQQNIVSGVLVIIKTSLILISMYLQKNVPSDVLSKARVSHKVAVKNIENISEGRKFKDILFRF